jgi:hypothetical protein
MQEAQNVYVRQRLRGDLLQYGRVLYVPGDMTDEEIREKYGDLLDKGLLKAVRRAAGGGGSEAGAGTERGSAAVKIPTAASRGTMSLNVPAAVQIFGTSSAAADIANVSRAIFGPCMIEHVRLWTLDLANALNEVREVGLSVCRQKDQTPFGGDLPVFEFHDPGDSMAEISERAVNLYDQRYETAVGYLARTMYEYFPRIPIPWPSFYLNFTVGKTNGVSNIYCDVSFGPIELAAVEAAKTMSVEPREVAPVAAAPAAKAVPTAESMTFRTYGEIKTFEALGNKIVWSTVGMTGNPAAPIRVTVIRK